MVKRKQNKNWISNPISMSERKRQKPIGKIKSLNSLIIVVVGSLCTKLHSIQLN